MENNTNRLKDLSKLLISGIITNSEFMTLKKLLMSVNSADIETDSNIVAVVELINLHNRFEKNLITKVELETQKNKILKGLISSPEMTPTILDSESSSSEGTIISLDETVEGPNILQKSKGVEQNDANKNNLSQPTPLFKKYTCSKCGKEISRKENLDNMGICDNCHKPKSSIFLYLSLVLLIPLGWFVYTTFFKTNNEASTSKTILDNTSITRKFKMLDNSSNVSLNNFTFTGELLHKKEWEDLNGYNVVLFTKNYDELYVLHYSMMEGNINTLIEVKDFEHNCEYDLFLDFITESILVSDLDNDNYGEITFAYKKACASDLTPKELKLFMLENGEKHIIRGTTLLNLNGELWGGAKNIDESFNNAPEVFLTYLNQLWNKIVEEKNIPFNQTGTINGEDVIIRKDHSASSKIIGSFKYNGEKVEIIEEFLETNNSQALLTRRLDVGDGDQTIFLEEGKAINIISKEDDDYYLVSFEDKQLKTHKLRLYKGYIEFTDSKWYKIKRNSGEVGWVFGKFITVNSLISKVNERSENVPQNSNYLDLKLIHSVCFEENECIFEFVDSNYKKYTFEWFLEPTTAPEGSFEDIFIKKFGSRYDGFEEYQGKFFRVYYDENEVSPGNCKEDENIGRTCTKILNMHLVENNSTYSNSTTSYSSGLNYSDLKGIYQVYLNGTPMVVSGSNMYYALTSNGFVYMGFGSTHNSFSESISGNYNSSSIVTGTYSISGENIEMDLKGARMITSWRYEPNSRTFSKDNMVLKWLKSYK